MRVSHGRISGVDDQAWTPRRGAPARREGESREQYSQRIRAERNRRHRDSVKKRAAAASAAGKVAAAAAKPALTRAKAQAPAAGHEPTYLPASVLTNTGRYTFDTADPADIARIKDILRSEPGPEQVDPDTLHAALTRIPPGTTLSLPTQSDPTGTPSNRSKCFLPPLTGHKDAHSSLSDACRCTHPPTARG